MPETTEDFSLQIGVLETDNNSLEEFGFALNNSSADVSEMIYLKKKELQSKRGTFIMDFSNLGIGKMEMDFLIESIKSNPLLTNLNLKGNKLKDEGICTLLSLLLGKTNLTQ